MRRARRALDGLDDDIRDHIERETQDNLDRGMSPEEAHRQARLKFGNVALTKEDTRAVWAWQWLEQLVEDSRYTIRTLRRSPGYAAVAVLTLALGIGANTAIFSVVYTVLLRPLPYASPEELVTISSHIAQTEARFPTLPVRAVDFLELRRSSRELSALSAVSSAEFNLTGTGEPERLYGARVSSNFFSTVGIEPAIGRAFAPDEDEPGRDQVVILSHDLWVGRFGADYRIIGRPLSLNGQAFTVIGVMPRDFLFPVGRQLHQYVPFGPRVDIWKPMAFSKDEATSEGSWNYGVIARVKTGTNLAVAQEELTAIAGAISERVRVQSKGLDIDIRLQLKPIREVFSGNIRGELVLLMAAVALLLLIACINLANLLVARANSQMRELATRAAFGASRFRLMRQVLTESGIVALLGAGVALIAAFWGTQVLVSLAPPDSRAALSTSPLNGPVLLFTMLVALVTGLVVGLVPALEIGRRSLFNDLRDGSRGATTSVRGIRLGQALVALETAFTCGLAIVACLLLHSFVNVLHVDKGFRTEQVLAVDLSLPSRSYGPAQADQFYWELLERTRGLPGVHSAGAVNVLPLVSESTTRLIRFEEDADYTHDVERPVAVYRVATPGYLATIGVPLQAGRFFQEQEPQPSAVISAGLARRLWPTEELSSVIGRRIRPGDLNSPLVTVVGIVGDVRSGALDREPMPAIYRPQRRSGWLDMTLVARTSSDPLALGSAIRAELKRLDNDLPISAIRTLDDVVSASVATRRFQTTLLVLFAVLALTLAAVGVYGVTSYAVSRQTREIGVRIALGAERSRVLSTVIIRGLRPVALGLAIGLVAATLAARAIRSFLFGIGATDPTAFAAASGVIVIAAALACYLPARRAAEVDPASALRLE
ncbi:MAG: ADOP family duplicated permease [Vicinamibacteraceae bacterium]